MKIFIGLVLTLLFALTIFAQKQAEVTVPTTYLRKLPDVASEKVQTVQKGEKITFEKMRETNGWYFVSVSNGTVKGWIRKDTISAAANVQKVTQAPKENAVAPPTSPKTAPIPVATPAASPSPAAEVPAQVVDEEVINIKTEEINLNVRVVDDNNRPVINLNQSHFKVYEDDVLQPITSLTVAEAPIINALLIDNSRSLRAQLGKIIEAGKIIVGTNRPQDETTVVRFVSKDKIEVVQDFTINKNLLGNALENLFVEGGQTAIVDAVYRTAKKVEQYQNSQKKDDVKTRALILVSDGDDRNSSFQEQQLFELLRASQVQIYAVGFVNDLSAEADASGKSRQEKARNFMTRLAQETGGKVYFPNSIDELPQIASDISRELHTQYLISYTPTNERRDGVFRKIKVEVADGANKEKRIAVTRTGRTSAPK